MDRPVTQDRTELLKAAYRKMADLRKQLDAAQENQNEPVAIVGMACRMPGGAEDPEAFWQSLIDGVDGTREIPSDRWDVDAYYDPDPDAPHKMYVRRGGFLTNLRGFDPLFFHVSPIEAASMDPQQRILLEVTWEALENAGWAPTKLTGTRTGVFVGTSGSDFGIMALMAMRQNAGSSHLATGVSPSITAGHLSYFLGLRGPCMALDTACSSALTAVHTACASLRKGESTAAIAGAVNLVVSPDGNIIVSKARMLAPDGHCKTFDALADGYARSEGCGVVVLKLLSQAQADGDRILGVIRGSACNQDGRTNGITAPSGNAQREVVQAALAAAGIGPAEIEYVETHGTGTALGDPIEVQALGEVFAPGRAADNPVVLGAVKSNIGHLECTAGMAALIKATMVLQKGEIPPNLHFHTPNPHIPWDRLPFKVPTRRTAWPANGAPRKAGVSAFGFSGTNVHLILEEPPAPPPRSVADRDRHLLVLSGLTPQALTDLAARYVAYFEGTPDADLGDVCFTASAGRSHFPHRLAVTADRVGDLIDTLNDFLALPEQGANRFTGVAPNRAPGIGLVLATVSPALGERLYREGSAYQAAFDAVTAAAEARGVSLPANEDVANLARAYAAARQWIDWGVTPVALSGSGPALIAAATVAGAIGVEDALSLVLDAGAAISWSAPQLAVLSPGTGAALTADGLRDGSGAALSASAIIDGMAHDGARLVVSFDDALASTDTLDVISVCGDGWGTIVDAFGRLYTRGVTIDWQRFEAPWTRRRLALPTYPFQRQECWMDIQTTGPVAMTADAATTPLHPLLGRRLHAATFRNERVFEATFTPFGPALLQDHKFYSTIVVSMTTMLEMALTGGCIALGADALVEDIVVEQPLLVPADQTRIVQTVFTPDDQGFAFAILSADPAKLDEQAGWERHCTGRVVTATVSHRDAIDPQDLLAHYSQTAEPDWFYDTVSKSGVDYGPSFRALQTIKWEGKGTFAKLALPEEWSRDAADYSVHPGLLDAAIQAFGLSATIGAFDGSDEQHDIYMPVGIEHYSVTRPAGSEIWCHATVRPATAENRDSFIGDVALYDISGESIGLLNGVLFKRNVRRQLAREIDERRLDTWLYEPQWEVLAGATPDVAATGQRWLVIGEGVLALALADQLRAVGATPVLVGRSDYDSIVRDAIASGKLDGIAYIADEAGTAPVAALARDQAINLLDLVQALLRAGVTSLTNFALITRGFRTPSIADGGALAGGILWGFGRVVANEIPELNCHLYDVDPLLSAPDVAERLVAELVAPDAENQIALDRTDRFALRLKRSEGANAESHQLGTGPIQLDIGSRGDFRQLRFVPQPALPAPGPNEVQMRVLATAMNFRDVLNVLGMYPGDPGDPGVECVGEIVAIGRDVVGVAPGDHVLAIPYKGYSTFANAPMNMVFKRPEALSLAESATLLVAYLTAAYSLSYLGRMKAGERVLVHAGAGGVGLAAIMLAQRAGAEVFATAGSPAKRDYLRRIGVDHVLDSRSIQFADQIRELTGGEGIDLVLNSLTGPAMEQSLRLLRTGGRFLEIGRTDVYTPEQAETINPGIYHKVVELLEPFQDEADLMQRLFDDIREGLSSGTLRPLPYKAFGLDETTQAFRYMSAARHIGKIVVVDRSAEGYQPFEPSGTYLVTGGLGGLGLVCGLWLATQGARSIILVSRRAPGPDEQAAIAAMEAAGATVHIGQADVGDRAQVEDLLARYVSPARPLRGILHSAGVVDDGIIAGQDHERFDKVMRAKVDGAWLLHELTLKSPLEFFVLFSSGAGLFGNPGQSSYAAASVFLDELARARQNGGLPALSVDWGPWAEVGMAARMDQRHAKDWDSQGLSTISPQNGLTVLEMLVRLNRHDQVAVLPFDAAFWKQAAGQTTPFLSGLVQKRSEPVAAANHATIDAAARLQAAEPGRQSEVLIEIITEIVVDVFGLDPSRALSADQNLTEIGMDSLMAIQLSNRLKSAFSEGMPATLAFELPTIQEIGEYLLEKMPVNAGSTDSVLLTEAPTIRDLVKAIEEKPDIEAGPRLFTFREGDTSPPLILLPSMAGTALHWRPFATAFQSGRPVAGIYFANEPDYDKESSLEDLARQCAQLIADTYPDRPCHLLGYSFGGILAVEVARQLQKLGHKSGVTTVLDTWPRLDDQERPSGYLIAKNMAGRFLSSLGSGNPRQKLQTLLWVLKIARTSKGGTEAVAQEFVLGDSDDTERSRRIVSWFSDLQSRYKPEPYTGDLLVVRASKLPLWGPFDHDLGWSKYVTGAVSVEILDGGHSQMLEPAQMKKLMERLSKQFAAEERNYEQVL